MANNSSFSINQNFNIVLFIQILISILITGFLALRGVESASKIILMFLISVALLVLIFLFIKEDSKESIFRYIRVPFTTSNLVAAFGYIIGWSIPLVLVPFKVFTGKFLIPLATSDINAITTQSFSNLQASLSPSVNFLITVWNAGTNEEFLFGFILVAAFGIIASFLVNNVLKLRLQSKSRNNLITGIAIVAAALAFTGTHVLNDTYTAVGMFVGAFIFRLILNMGIYYVGLFLTFTVGFHQSNNAVYFFTEFGGELLRQALLSPIGLIIILQFVVLLFYLLLNIRSLPSELRSAFRRKG